MMHKIEGRVLTNILSFLATFIRATIIWQLCACCLHAYVQEESPPHSLHLHSSHSIHVHQNTNTLNNFHGSIRGRRGNKSGPLLSSGGAKGKEIMNTRISEFNWKNIHRPTGIARFCDAILLDYNTTLIKKPLGEVRTIFANMRLRKDGWYQLDNFLRLLQPSQQRVVVIAAGEDWTFPNSIDARDPPTTPKQKVFFLQVIKNPQVIRFYIENMDERSVPSKMHALPLGLSPLEGSIFMNYFTPFIVNSSADFLDRPLKFTNLNRVRMSKQFTERRVVRDLTLGPWSSWHVIPPADERIDNSTDRISMPEGAAVDAAAPTATTLATTRAIARRRGVEVSSRSRHLSQVAYRAANRAGGGGSYIFQAAQSQKPVSRRSTASLDSTNHKSSKIGTISTASSAISYGASDLIGRSSSNNGTTAKNGTAVGALKRTAQHAEYLRFLGSYPFTIGVHGGGIDPNPKVWEAMLLGVIPIIKRSALTYIYEEEDLPVVVVDAWTPELINQQNLTRWRKQFAPYITDPEKRRATLEKLTLDYWWRKVTASLQQPED